MKIAVDARTMGAKPSGVGIYTYNYIKELIKSEHEIILITDVSQSSQMKEIEQYNLTVLSFGRSVYQSMEVFQYFKFLNKCLIDLKPDLFWEPNALIPIKLKHYQGKTMITVHDMFPITKKEYYSLQYRLYFRMSLKKTLNQTDGIIYNSLETKEITENIFEKAKKKHSFLGYVIFESNKESIPKVKENYNKPFFLYIGNMEKRKGVDLLINAYLQYCKNGGKNDLYLAGKMREQEINNLLEKTKENYKTIHYLGYVENNQIRDLYDECDCFIFPSKAEGFGLPIIEAMEYNKPIIASDLTIFHEIAGNSINYFGLGNEAVNELCLKMTNYNNVVDADRYQEIKDRFSRDKLGKNFREFVDSFL